jgi:hypothetical protein
VLIQPTIEGIPFERLDLDAQNPRLPESLQGAGSEELLEYLSANVALDELVQSFADNGFFQHEPLIGVESGNGRVTIVEGNRRLAALKILLAAPEALGLGLKPILDGPLSREVRAQLEVIPTYLVGDRDEVSKYLGFRHIGGIKTWSAEAKARYLMLEADRVAESTENPFLEVARRIGSDSQGVRNAYTAIRALRHARDEFGLDVSDVLFRRFGVWSRCMTAANVRHYIGLNGKRDYWSVVEEIESLEREPIAEVIDDLSARGDTPAVLYDSRDVTVYGKVLQHEQARKVMRRYRSLDAARQIVELAELPLRIENLREQVIIARDEAERAEWSQPLHEAAEGLFKAGRALWRAVQDLADDGD